MENDRNDYEVLQRRHQGGRGPLLASPDEPVRFASGPPSPSPTPLQAVETRNRWAREYGLSRGNVYHWSQQGCPFDDGVPSVLAWAIRNRKMRRTVDAIADATMDEVSR